MDERYQRVELTWVEQQYVDDHGTPLRRGRREIYLLAQDDDTCVYGYRCDTGDVLVLDGLAYRNGGGVAVLPGASRGDQYTEVYDDWYTAIDQAMERYGGAWLPNCYTPGKALALPLWPSKRSGLLRALRTIDGRFARAHARRLAAAAEMIA